MDTGSSGLGKGPPSLSKGVVHQNVAQSLRTLLDALDPIGSLPVLSFLAMASPRTTSLERSLPSVGLGPILSSPAA